VYDFSTTGDIRRRISGNTAVRYIAVTGTYETIATVNFQLSRRPEFTQYIHSVIHVDGQADSEIPTIIADPIILQATAYYGLFYGSTTTY
jgi:hypothetical protein